MLVQQACVSKANSLQGQNFSLIALNYSILEFVKRASSVEFPTAVQNSSIFQALFYDIVEYVDMVSFYKDVFDAVQMKGFDAIVFRAASHDFTYLSYLTLRYYKRSDCPVPIYVITEKRFPKLCRISQM
jgi:hypothetical protein